VSAFKVVQDALVAALLLAPQITGARVYLGRARPMPAEHASDINISIESISGEQFAVTSGPVLWSVIYGLELRVRGSASVDAMAALDPVLDAAYARIVATAPPAGVEGWVITPRARIDIEEADTPIASMTLALDVQLRTQAGTLTLAP
jgi:hypothetical protein